LRATEPDPGWLKLGAIERSNTYFFILRNGTCQRDRIQNVQPDKIELASGKGLMRSDLIYIGESLSAHDVLYSGRSSWVDVKNVRTVMTESLEIRLKSGRSLSGSLVRASDSDLSLRRFGRSIKIPKLEIAQVNYVRFKPVSERHKYLAQEAPELEFLDPKWWQYLLRVDALQSVRIYDAAIPEDNSPLACSNVISQK